MYTAHHELGLLYYICAVIRMWCKHSEIVQSLFCMYFSSFSSTHSFCTRCPSLSTYHVRLHSAPPTLPSAPPPSSTPPPGPPPTLGPCYGSYRDPSCSDEGGCPYMAEWSVSGGVVRFRVSAMVADSDWAAIGFSDDTAMVSVYNSSLVLVCW